VLARHDEVVLTGLEGAMVVALDAARLASSAHGGGGVGGGGVVMATITRLHTSTIQVKSKVQNRETPRCQVSITLQRTQDFKQEVAQAKAAATVARIDEVKMQLA